MASDQSQSEHVPTTPASGLRLEPPDVDIAIARLIMHKDDAFKLSRELRAEKTRVVVRDPRNGTGHELLEKAIDATLVYRCSEDSVMRAQDEKLRPYYRGGDGHNSRQFFSGDWFEYAVYALMCELQEDEQLAMNDVIHDLSIEPTIQADQNIRKIFSLAERDPAFGQIDVAALHRERLVLIECKDQPLSEQVTNTKRMMEKLALLCKLVGGRYAAGLLVCPAFRVHQRPNQTVAQIQAYDAELKQHARLMGITLVELRPEAQASPGLNRWETAKRYLKEGITEAVAL